MSKIHFRIAATREIAQTPPLQLLRVTSAHSFNLAATRADGFMQDYPAAPDEVVMVELDSGLRFWTSAQQFRDEVLRVEPTRGAVDAVVVPASLPGEDGTRGLVGRLVIKTLSFFHVDVTNFIASNLCQAWENRCLKFVDEQGAVLRRVDSKGDDLKLFAIPTDDLKSGDKPMLLFLHGTASSTAGSFGELWDGNNRGNLRKLLAAYDTVLALEHRTLTQSPIRNALDLLDQLPVGARLHLVSHSRGGLVGELLCRGDMAAGRAPFTEQEMRLFAEMPLEELNTKLEAKRIKVERFVRTACPARGTTLASERFDLFLSGMLNQLERVPAFSGLVFDVLFELAMGVAKARLDPSILPGLEAMVPDRPLVQLLNGTGAPLNGRLRVIAGDIEGNSLGSLFKTLLTDPLYQHDHDLVVNTASMFGGATRVEKAGYYFRRGPDVSHFRYFKNGDSVERLVAALTKPAGESDGFIEYDLRASDAAPPYPEARAPRALRAQKRGAVFLLPGIMGSHLKAGNSRVWFDPLDMANGGLDRLKASDANIEAEAPIELYYGRMREALASEYEVVPFAYDWRLSLTLAARRLATAVSAKLDELEGKNQPLHLVAHSMGGLVVRAMIARHNDVWQRLCRHQDARLVMLGTPNAGSHAIGMLLTGRDKFIRMLETLDLKHKMAGLLDIVKDYPGVLELLPASLRDGATWREIHKVDDNRAHWHVPDALALGKATATWQAILNDGKPPLERSYYIAGSDSRTPCAIEIVSAGANQVLQFSFTSEGDGRVPWATGIPEGMKVVWYADAAHGDLCQDETVADAVLDLLARGESHRLPKKAPVARGVAMIKRALPLAPTCLYPSFEEITAAALGGRPRPLVAAGKRKTRVTLTHGNLAYAKYPVMVGHYQGDTLVSAEEDLDRALNGELAATLCLGLYPGALDTAEVFLNPNGRPSGGIIIGLGQIGALAPGDLERAVSRGVRQYGAMLADGLYATGIDRRHAGLSILLVGTNAAGVGVSDAIAAILRGVAKGLDGLEKCNLANVPHLEEVELVELYEDRAILAARILEALRRDSRIAERFEIGATVQGQSRRGGRQRAYCDEQGGWWQRLQIVEDKQGRLAFNLLTDRARAESHIQPTQRKLVDSFIKEAAETGAVGMDVAATLYEMVVPNDLKEYAPDQRDMVLVLDEKSARYPWELMREGKVGKQREPLSVAAGMLRQLQAIEFRKKISYANGNNVLVVGDPDLGKDNKDFRQLTGARAEAQAVKKLLDRRGYDVADAIGGNAREIMERLHGGAYRILHLAGHGVHSFEVKKACDCCGGDDNRDPQTLSGMVIGPDLFLTPADIRQLRAVPELVFINCCHLGRMDERTPGQKPADLPKLAANLAVELIRMGVRAVVAAGWEVNDAAAKEFADTFYTAMLDGQTFGDAIKQARCDIYLNYPGGNTWGAYQCYGDPSYRLDTTDESGAKGSAPTYHMPVEAVIALENLAADATTASKDKQVEIRKKVEEVEAALPRDWLEMGAVRAALGMAYSDLGEFENAIHHYRFALQANDGRASIRVAEQLANLEARVAVKAVRKDKSYANVERTFKDATHRILSLMVSYGETVERHIILGSILKREALAMLLGGRFKSGRRPTLRSILEKARDSYVVAADLHKQIEGAIYPYPVLYAAAIDVIRSKLGYISPPGPDFQIRLDEARDAGKNRVGIDPQFWNVIIGAEVRLVRALAEGDLELQADSISESYRVAMKGEGSQRERESVKEHLEFLLAFHETNTTQRQSDAEGLRQILDQVASQ